MTEQEDKKRYEQNFRDIFSKVNKALPVHIFIITMIAMLGFWGSMFGLVYVDQQDHKEIANKQYIEVVKELGGIKTLIGTIKK